MTARADAIVVGAGLSGLKAACDLARNGKRVIVLEAQSRVGGRVLGGELCGHAIDHGAQWVSPRHARVLAEARRFGMETQLQYSEGKTILSLEGRRSEFVGEVPGIAVLAQVELAMLQRRWSKEIATLPPGAPWNAAKAKEWDSQTLETWIRKNLSTEASCAFAWLVPAAYGAQASEVSYLWMLEMLRSTQGFEQLMNVKGGVRDATIKNGSNTLTHALAKELGDAIVLAAPVRSIVQNEGGVVVATDKVSYEADYAIVAVAPMLCAAMDFNKLPPRRSVLALRMPPTPVMKFHIAYEDCFWRRRGYSGQAATDFLPLGQVMEGAHEPPILIGIAQGRHMLELAAMQADKRRKRVVACLVDLFGPDASEPVGYAEKDWMADDWAGGHVASMAPGVLTQYGDALREPCGRVHWAGCETAREWSGHMEGALESGERAASEVLARL
jgi:monoamine oxidase